MEDRIPEAYDTFGNFTAPQICVGILQVMEILHLLNYMAQTYTLNLLTHKFGSLPEDSDPTSWSFLSYSGDRERSSLSFSAAMQLCMVLLPKHMYRQDLIEWTQIISALSFLQMSLPWEWYALLLLWTSLYQRSSAW